MRVTLKDFRLSRAPEALGACAADVPRLASYVNEATHRLLIAGGETGWYGTWQKMVFTVDPNNAYITLPRSVARLINIDVCKFPIRIQNEFYEFLEAGIGLQPQNSCSCPPTCAVLESYDRGNVPIFSDIVATGNPKIVRVFLTNDRDVNIKRVLIQGLDNNGNVVRTIDNGVDVEGVFITLRSPFSDSGFYFSKITGIQKDVTAGNVLFYEVDSVTGVQRKISQMEPGETSAWYRRYFINGVCNTCCDCEATPGSACTPSTVPKTAQITAMAKLEYIPVTVDTDYLIIGNIPALKQECMAVRYEESDSSNSLQMAVLKHRQAIKLLNQELEHYTGRLQPAIGFHPFGTADLKKQSIGTLI